MAEIFPRLAESVIHGEIEDAVMLTKGALEQGHDAENILRNGLLAGMDVVGQRFKVGDMFIPEVLLSGKAMNSAMEVLRPHFGEVLTKSFGTIVIGTVKGDLHDIGKNLVAMMIRGAGYNVIDLGINQDGQNFVDAIKKYNAQVVGISSLLTTTMPEMKNVIEILKEEGLRKKVKVMVGGAPVTQKFAGEIGADGYAPDAVTAVEKLRELTF